jgi:hypothetical protein
MPLDREQEEPRLDCLVRREKIQRLGRGEWRA